MRRLLFWSATGLLAYTYVLFPLLVLLRAALRPRPYDSRELTPSVTLVISARNEAASIGAKLENLLSLDYPDDRLEVVIASDGSDDGTDELVQGYAGRVRLVALSRVGKAAALNAAVAEAGGEILVFSDANSIYAPDALRALVSRSPTRPSAASPATNGIDRATVRTPSPPENSATGTSTVCSRRRRAERAAPFRRRAQSMPCAARSSAPFRPE